MNEIIITLTPEEMDTLSLALGYATGAAFKDNNRKLARAFIELTNSVHKNNPDYVPYEMIPE
jgi:hypothetical protein